MIDLYSFQRWPDIVKSFGHSGSYTPSWSAARRQAIADDGDEDWCFNPVDPVGLPPVWLLVRGDEAPRPGMPCLTLAVTALDGADEEGEVHAAVETGWPKKLPEGALNGARFALWVLRDLLDGGSQEC